MTSVFFASRAVLLAWATVLSFGVACAGRSVPGAFPPQSPSSLDANEAPPFDVTQALNADIVEQAASAATYRCPMHRDVVSSEPGQCPRCGMDLEAEK